MEIPSKIFFVADSAGQYRTFSFQNKWERERPGSTELSASEILFWLSMARFSGCHNVLRKCCGSLLLFQQDNFPILLYHVE